MVAVKPHIRGVVVIPEAGERPSEVGRRLRRHLAGYEILPIGGRFVVPMAATWAVVDAFGRDEAQWDEQVWTIATDQRGRHHDAKVARRAVEAALADPQGSLRDYDRLPLLDLHQAEAVAAISVPNLPGIALFDEQGTGKTRTTLAAFDRLHSLGVVRRLLVVAPKTVLGVWKEDAANFLQGKYRIVVVAGPVAQRRRLLRQPHDILVVTYEGVVRDRLSLEARLAAEPHTYMLAVDESYLAKNPATARSCALAALRPFCERAVVLCGTPAPNSARDVVNQIDLVDLGATFGRVSLPRDEGEARVLVRRTLQDAVVLRRLKEEVFPDIPGKRFERLYVDLNCRQREMYEQARNELILNVSRVDQREFSRRLQSFLARRLVLLQIASHPGVFDVDYSEEPAKFAALDYLVDRLVRAQGLKLVIWSFFRFSLTAIARRYAHLGLVRIDGSVQSAKERAELIARFQHDPRVFVFVGNPAATGAGITLTAAHHVVYESFSNQAVHYLQSIDRVHRRGQKHDVTYHVVLARETLDVIEFERLLLKERSGRELLGDRYEDLPTREQLLADLGAEADEGARPGDGNARQ